MSNKHDLEKTGNTVGQVFETGKFDANYTRKKGMRFFTVLVIIMVLAIIVLFSIKRFPSVQILYLDDNAIVLHEIKTNTFGKSRIANETVIDYYSYDFEYKTLTGKAAQARKIIDENWPEIIAGDSLTMLMLADAKFIADAKWYVSRQFKERWLVADAVSIGSLSDLVYGIQVEESRYYQWLPRTGCVGIIKNYEGEDGSGLKRFMIRELTLQIIAGEPYGSGKKSSGKRILD